jgi:hypothetical protein
LLVFFRDQMFWFTWKSDFLISQKSKVLMPFARKMESGTQAWPRRYPDFSIFGMFGKALT